MGRRAHPGLTDNRSALVEDFRRGLISAGELSRRLVTSRARYPRPPGEPERRSARAARADAPRLAGGSRAWLAAAVILVAVIGGIVGSAVGAQHAAGGSPVQRRRALLSGRVHTRSAAKARRQTASTASQVAYTAPSQTSTSQHSTSTTTAAHRTRTNPATSTGTATTATQTLSADGVAPTSTTTTATTTSSTPTSSTTSNTTTTESTTTASSTADPATTGSTQGPTGSGGAGG